MSTAQSTGTKVRAMVVRELGAGWVEEEIYVADPIGQEVLVDVKASGLCGSDDMIMKRGVLHDPPNVLGHEVAGIVEKIGPAVTEFEVGDHVVACLVQYCGKCVQCLTGAPTLCLNPDFPVRGENEPPRLTDTDGKPLDQGLALGGFAEKSLVHENMLVKLPKDMPFKQAAVIGCGVVTGAGAAMNSAQVAQGEDVAVIGSGGVGLNAINGAALAGAGRIIAIDVHDDSLESAKKFGATHTINSTKQDPVEAVREITDGAGVRASFDIVGIGATARQGYDMLAHGGTLYQVGLGSDTDTLDVPPIDNIMESRGVQGVAMGSVVPKRDIPMFVKHYQAGRLNLDDLVSKEIKLSEVNEGYEMSRDPKINRVVITDFS